MLLTVSLHCSERASVSGQRRSKRSWRSTCSVHSQGFAVDCAQDSRIGGPGSSVGIATDYGLDGPGSNPGGDEIFCPARSTLGPTQPPVKWVPGLSRG